MNEGRNIWSGWTLRPLFQFDREFKSWLFDLADCCWIIFA